MVAEQDKTRRIGIRELRDHLSEVVREVREGEVSVDVTVDGQPMATIVPIRPAATRPAPAEVIPGEEDLFAGIDFDAERAADPKALSEKIRLIIAEAWEARRARTGPYVFDQAEHDLIMEERRKLIEKIGKHMPPGTPVDAVAMVRDQWRDH